MRPVFEWNTGARTLQLGKRTYVMGVLNVTPDSFSDGGQHLDPEAALQHALKMLEEGADIIDIGGESTRPGAKTGDSAAAKPAVSEKEELGRVVPVIRALKKKKPDCIISVDTYKAAAQKL